MRLSGKRMLVLALLQAALCLACHRMRSSAGAVQAGPGRLMQDLCPAGDGQGRPPVTQGDRPGGRAMVVRNRLGQPWLSPRLGIASLLLMATLDNGGE
jgi:hypothetical protein